MGAHTIAGGSNRSRGGWALPGPPHFNHCYRKTKIATDWTEVAHVTRDSDTTFKVKGSPGRFITHRGLNAWGRCSGDRENVLGVGNHCYVASARRRARRWGAHEGGEGRGHIVSPPAQLVIGCNVPSNCALYNATNANRTLCLTVIPNITKIRFSTIENLLLLISSCTCISLFALFTNGHVDLVTGSESSTYSSWAVWYTRV